MSAESYYELITPERFSEPMKRCLKEAYEKLTKEYLYNYKDDYKKYPYPERMVFSECGEPEKRGESDVCFSGTDCLGIVDGDYIRIFFDEIAKAEPLMPFDFRLSYAISEGHFKMHVKYRGDGRFGYLYFDTLNSGGDCSVSCPECGCTPDFDTYPDWVDPDECPNCGESLNINESVDYDYGSYDFFSSQVVDRIFPFKDYEVCLTNDKSAPSGSGKSFIYWRSSKRGEKPPIPEKGAHVVLLAPSPIDKGILSPFEFVYEDRITDETDLIVIGTDCRCYYYDYGRADLSQAICSSPDTADIGNWSVNGKPVTDSEEGYFVDRGDYNIEKMIPILDLLESFYNNGGQIPFVILYLW